MNPCSEALKQAREKLNLSLEDISIATKINVKFLQAIEEGKFDFLDQVYVRAFIRSFAKQVGLDPEECVSKYNQSISPKEITSDSEKTIEIIPKIEKANLPKKKPINQASFLIIISFIVVGALILTLNPFNGDKTIIEKEIPFSEAIKNIERKQSLNESITSDSAKKIEVISGTQDSLILSISTIETSWISVLIDEKNRYEILLMPNRSIVWKASNNFKLTTGNAGALNVRLNNKTLPSLGKRGEVVRDINLSRANLE